MAFLAGVKHVSHYKHHLKIIATNSVDYYFYTVFEKDGPEALRDKRDKASRVGPSASVTQDRRVGAITVASRYATKRASKAVHTSAASYEAHPERLLVGAVAV